MKKTVKRVLDGIIGLPRKYNKLIEEAVWAYREEQLTLVGAEVKISPESEQNSRKGVIAFKGITVKGAGDNRWSVISLWQRRFLDSL